MEPSQQPDYFGNRTTQPVVNPPQTGVPNLTPNVPIQPQLVVANPVNPLPPTPQAVPTPSPVSPSPSFQAPPAPTPSPVSPSPSPFKQEEAPLQGPDGIIRWVASESTQYDRGSAWFIILALFSISLILLDIFLLKYYSFSAVVLVVFVSLIINAIRPPRRLNYALSPEQGLYINNQLYSLENFSSFGVITENNQPFIKLIPIKRFGTGLSIYFPEELGEEIVDVFGEFLPMTEVKLDIIDIITRKLKL